MRPRREKAWPVDAERPVIAEPLDGTDVHTLSDGTRLEEVAPARIQHRRLGLPPSAAAPAASRISWSPVTIPSSSTIAGAGLPSQRSITSAFHEPVLTNSITTACPTDARLRG